jgi:hypothetical protein
MHVKEKHAGVGVEGRRGQRDLDSKTTFQLKM